MLCTICKTNEITSTNPETTFCRECFYSGAVAEQTLRPLLDRIDALDEVSQNAAVWHTGGGCFNLAVHLADGRLLTPSIGYEENGGVWPEPGFPESEDDRWCIVVSDSVEVWEEWDEERLFVVEDLYTNDGLVEAIAKIARGEIVRPVEVA